MAFVESQGNVAVSVSVLLPMAGPSIQLPISKYNPVSQSDRLKKNVRKVDNAIATRYAQFKLLALNDLEVDTGNRCSGIINKSWTHCNRPMGLANSGVTCYINAALQSLFHIPAFHNFLADVYKGHYPELKSPLAYFLAEIQHAICHRNKKYLVPTSIFTLLSTINPSMSDKTQEDCHEFFMSVLSVLQSNTVPSGHKMNTSIIHTIFGGVLEQTVRCQECQNVSITKQEFMDLSVSFSKKMASYSESRDKFTLESAIKEHFEAEWITKDDNNNGYHCPSCLKDTVASCQSTIIEAPEHLIITIKRFRLQDNTWCKTRESMDYPLDLDMTDHASNKDIPICYRLTSVTIHGGNAIGCGHFVTHCVQPNGTWGMYDDHRVASESVQSVLSYKSSCYILVYTRYTAVPIDMDHHASIATAAPPAESFPRYDPNENTVRWTGESSKIGYVFPSHCRNPNVATHKPGACCHSMPKAVRVKSVGQLDGMPHKVSSELKTSKLGSKSPKKKFKSLPSMSGQGIEEQSKAVNSEFEARQVASPSTFLLNMTPVTSTTPESPKKTSASPSAPCLAATTEIISSVTKFPSNNSTEQSLTESDTNNSTQELRRKDRRAVFMLGPSSPSIQPTTVSNNETSQSNDSMDFTSALPESLFEAKSSGSRLSGFFKKMSKSSKNLDGKNDPSKNRSSSMNMAKISSMLSFGKKKREKVTTIDSTVSDESKSSKL